PRTGQRPGPRSHAAASGSRAARPQKPRVRAVSWARPPVHIGAHAWPKLRYLVDRVSADRERAQVEIAGRTRGAPARILALGGDQPDFDRDAAVTERRDADVEAITDLRRIDHILAQIEMCPAFI